MQKKNFEYRVLANVLITKAELAHIMAVGAKHYDSKCQEFAKTTVRYWHDWCGGGKEDPPETVKEIAIKWDEFDIVSKILEQEHYHKESGIELYDPWTTIFRQIREENERINAHWMIEDAGTYTDVYRTELKAKYGDGKAVVPPTA